MRLITHNFLKCHVKGCEKDNFPLLINNATLERTESDYDEKLIRKLLDRLEWDALYETTISLGINCLPKEKPEEFTPDLLQSLHEILLTVRVKDGTMLCRGCNHVYVIKDGISNMLLQDYEV